MIEGARKTRKSRMGRSAVRIILLCVSVPVLSWPMPASMVSGKKSKGCFTLSSKGKSATLVVSAADFKGVVRAVKMFQADVERVTKSLPRVATDTLPSSKEIVVIGTIGKSPLIDRLAEAGKIRIQDIAGKWESTLIQTVDNPFQGVNRALVIAGSDRRGTIYGMFELSRRIGVSPWVWWADVPVKRQSALYVTPGRFVLGEPRVKYRGIFLNDEEPALGRWAVEKYGGFTHAFYEKVFELILRLRGNYLWPAMWWASFNADDPENPVLADEMGIVMGTSHHEPMLRAQQEWKRFGTGAWNYESNGQALREFWKQGILNMDSHESIVTIGMRGDGDLAMSESTNIALLERIVEDQRRILREATGRDAEVIPQDWALYKEVQDYYDKGMRVPDDVTLLLCDDNWGNIRRLPKLSDPPRSGGYGIYYHFDFVGGPRNYKWVNTCPIARVWEQMHLAYRNGVDRIWLVNVGDLKPMELPISFFLDFAWNPDEWPAERLPEYTRLWAAQQFGPEHAKDIADVLTRYTRYNGRRKPEMLDPGTYSLIHYQEWERIASDYRVLVQKAEGIQRKLAREYRDAYYELVLHPVLACSNLNDLYLTVSMNRLYARQGRASTNDLARKARALFERDAEISQYYNKILAGGKWNHMMDQTHIGYTSWQQPDRNVMPEVNEIAVPENAEMGVAIEGSEAWWPMDAGEAVLPEVDPYNRQPRFIEVFNRGMTPFEFTCTAARPWVTVSPNRGTVDREARLRVKVDWPKAPTGRQAVPITIAGPGGNRVTVQAVLFNPASPKPHDIRGFVESNGYVSIEAEHYTRKVDAPSVQWLRIPDFGRTVSGLTPVPVTAPAQTPGGNGPCLEYRMVLFNAGEVKVEAYVSPTQNVHGTRGLCYAVSFDDETPQIVNIHLNDTIPDWKYPPAWNEAVGRNIKVTVSKHLVSKPGEHVLKFWMVDPGIVLQKLVVDTGGLKSSYLGPPESYHRAVGRDHER